jgi:glycosyltransferase involved in cell wall biosynthesis
MANPPKISIVTPNYNCAEFLEQTMLSVLGQNYPSLEYIVIDDGSTDNSAEVIRRHESRLAYWTTRPNRGQYATINEGFERSTGEVMAWLNSDDMYLPAALSVAGEIFANYPEVEWLTTTQPAAWNEKGQSVGVGDMVGYSRELFLRGAHVALGRNYTRGYIQQESTFWRRSLWQRAGGRMDTSVTVAADFELWARFYQHAELYGVRAVLGGFRLRTGQNTDRFAREYQQQCREVLARYGGRQCGAVESAFRRFAARISLPLVKRIPGARQMGLIFPVKYFSHEGRGGNWVLREAVIC